MLLVGVGAEEVEGELIGGDLGHEVGTVLKILELVEFQLHEVVNSFDIGLHPMSAREDGVVTLTGERFDGAGIGGGFLGVPGTDILATVVGLADGDFGKGLKFSEEVVDVEGEELGVGEGEFVGKSEEEDAAGDLAVSVLDFGQVQEFGLEIILGDIHEVFGVLDGALKQRQEFFHGPQVIFGDMFFGSFSGRDVGLFPDLTDGFGGEG